MSPGPSSPTNRVPQWEVPPIRRDRGHFLPVSRERTRPRKGTITDMQNATPPPRHFRWQHALALVILAAPMLGITAALTGRLTLAIVTLTPPAVYGALIAAGVWAREGDTRAVRDRHPSSRRHNA